MFKTIVVPEFEVGDEVVLKNPKDPCCVGKGEVFGEVDDPDGHKWYLVDFGGIYGAFLAEELQYAPVEVGVPIDCLYCGEKHTPKHGYDLCCSPECYRDMGGEI